jgi:hypothetical protein
MATADTVPQVRESLSFELRGVRMSREMGAAAARNTPSGSEGRTAGSTTTVARGHA